jgi:ABC-type multidrug transport system fused ATPase/permease subunit
VVVLSYVDVTVQVMVGYIVDNIGELNAFRKYLILFVLLNFLLFFLQELFKVFQKRLSFLIIADLKEKLYFQVINIEPMRMFKWSQGNLFHLWDRDIQEINDISAGGVLNLTVLILSALFAFIQLLFVNYTYALIVVAITVVSFYPTKKLGEIQRNVQMAHRKKEIDINKIFFSAFDHAKLYRVFGKEKQLITKFDEENSKLNRLIVSRFFMKNFYRMLSRVLNALVPAFVLIISCGNLFKGQVSIGKIVVSLSLITTIQKPIAEFGSFIINIRGVGFKLDSLFSFLAEPKEGGNISELSTTKCQQSIGYIEMNKVGVHICEKVLLHDCFFSVRKGEKISIVGESGAGKSVLLQVIARLIPLEVGKVLINGNHYNCIPLQEYRKKISFCLSNLYIENNTLMNNMTLLGGDCEKVREIVEYIGFDHDISGMPEKFDTEINYKGTNLSGGQRRKVGFIRHAAIESEIYLFDEVTTGIDELTAKKMMQYMKKEIKGNVFSITHDIKNAKMLDRILVMHQGTIIDLGTHEQLIARCITYRNLYFGMEI